MLQRSSDSCAHAVRKCAGLASVVAILLAAAGSAAWSAPPAAAQAGPRVFVVPASELTDTQVVKVDWDGFPASGRTVIRECAAGATDPNTQCTGNLSVSFTNADGTGQGTYAALAFGTVVSPSQATFPCDSDSPCDIRLDLQDPQFQTVLVATTPIPASIFSKSFPPCPQGAAPLTGDGASEVQGATEAWIRDVC